MLRFGSYACCVAALATGVMFWVTAARRGCQPLSIDALTPILQGLLVFHLFAVGGVLLGLLCAFRGERNWWPVGASVAVIAGFWLVAWSWPC
jgi:hypothetical protein